MGAGGGGGPAYAIPCAFVSAHTRGTLECLQPFVHDMRELKRPSGVSLTKVLQKNLPGPFIPDTVCTSFDVACVNIVFEVCLF